MLLLYCHQTSNKGGDNLEKVKELRALIYGSYNSESEMADFMGWKRQRLNKITNGKKEPDLVEINELSRALDKSVEEIAQIFLRYKSPNEQQNKSYNFKRNIQ